MEESGRLTEAEFERAFAPLVASARKAGASQDTVFVKIGKLLAELGKREWSLRPRTYTVLRMINQAHYMDHFVTNGLLDVHLPYRDVASLPPRLNEASRHKFMTYQNVVLTAARDIEVEDGRHRHFNCDADCFFHIRGSLGNGRFGVVDHVESRLSLEEFARKRLHKSSNFKRRKEAVQAFENELQNLKRLRHHHLVSFVGSYTDRKYIAILMTPVADCDLHQYLSQDPFPPNELSVLRSFFGCLCGAVRFLHKSRCRHKDIKPANILLKNHEVYLSDFGTARDWSELTRGTTSGPTGPYTPRFAAPEVIQEKDRNESSDVWSLGCVYLEMLCILRGHKVEEMLEFFENNGTGRKPASCNYEALERWLVQLEIKGDNAPLKWIRQMLDRSRLKRPSAYDLFDTILNHEDEFVYIGPCCSTEEETSDVESSYQGSVFGGDDLHDLTITSAPAPPEISGPIQMLDDAFREDEAALLELVGKKKKKLEITERPHSEIEDPLNQCHFPSGKLSHRDGLQYFEEEVRRRSGTPRKFPPIRQERNNTQAQATTQSRKTNQLKVVPSHQNSQPGSPNMSDSDDDELTDAMARHLYAQQIQGSHQEDFDDESALAECGTTHLHDIQMDQPPKRKTETTIVFIDQPSWESDEYMEEEYDDMSHQQANQRVAGGASRRMRHESPVGSGSDAWPREKNHNDQRRSYLKSDKYRKQPHRATTDFKARPRSSDRPPAGRRRTTSDADYRASNGYHGVSNPFHPSFSAGAYPQMNHNPPYQTYYEPQQSPVQSSSPYPMPTPDPWEQYAYYFTEAAPDFKLVKHKVLQAVYQYMPGFAVFKMKGLRKFPQVILNDGYGFNQVIECNFSGEPLDGPLPFADRKTYTFPRRNPWAYGDVQPKIKTFLVSEFSSKALPN